MNELLGWVSDTNQLMLFSFAFMRMSGFVFFNPILGRKNIPVVVRGAFIMILSLTLYLYADAEVMEVVTNVEYSMLLIRELIIGLVMGFIMELFAMVFTYAGGIMDFQMGLSMATIYDAQNGEPIPLSGSFYNAFFIMAFFAMNGHLTLMKLVISSIQYLPFGTFQIPVEISQAVLDIFCQCITLAVQFAFPILATQFLIEFAVGILMKMIPQINIFVVNVQIKIVAGILILIVLFSPMGNYLQTIINKMLQVLGETLKLFIVS